MGTRRLPYPARLRDQLLDELPGIRGAGSVTVTPRDRDGRRCPAYEAAFYEVAAFYVSMGTSLDVLEAALSAQPGTVRTTQVSGRAVSGPATPTGPGSAAAVTALPCARKCSR